MQHKDMQRGVTRRTFIALAGALAVATSLPRTVMAAGAGSGSSAADSATDSAADGGGSAFGFIPKRGKTTVNQSPDKYTWYVKDYVGMNAAAVGYTSLGEDRLDKYGSGLLKIVYVASDGTYLNPTDEDLLKRYVVFAQNLQPNTEIKLTFLTDSDGKEYDSLVDYQSVEEIVLAVSKVGEQPGEALCMTPIEPSPDKYTRYVRDYVGRNLAACGYGSLGGDRMDEYGKAHVELVLITDNGTFLDPTDDAALSEWVVAYQDVEPNTPIAVTFLTDSDGVEYDSLVDSCSIESIGLYVTRIQQ